MKNLLVGGIPTLAVPFIAVMAYLAAAAPAPACEFGPCMGKLA